MTVIVSLFCQTQGYTTFHQDLFIFSFVLIFYWKKKNELQKNKHYWESKPSPSLAENRAAVLVPLTSSPVQAAQDTLALAKEFCQNLHFMCGILKKRKSQNSWRHNPAVYWTWTCSALQLPLFSCCLTWCYFLGKGRSLADLWIPGCLLIPGPRMVTSKCTPFSHCTTYLNAHSPLSLPAAIL